MLGLDSLGKVRSQLRKLIKTDKPILVTGSAGFIGFHLCKRLLDEGHKVVGIDNFNDYYDVSLKEDRNKILEENSNYKVYRFELSDVDGVKKVFGTYGFEYVVNLAAQAGVRYSLINPFAYTDSNITGFVNILERCKDHKVKHLLFASSSSVYGANTQMPFKTSDSVDHPISLYAATKKANELIAHSYSSSFKLPVSGLRFFTVYGPWGRPDMALFLFTKAILEGKPIDVFNHGDMKRDFTYVEDIVEGVFRLLSHPPESNPSWDGNSPKADSSFAPYQIHNIGNNSPSSLMSFINSIELELGLKATLNLLPIQTGDVPKTYADVQSLIDEISYQPSTKLQDGVHQFVRWYKSYYL